MAVGTLTPEEQQRIEQAIDQYSFPASLAPGGAEETFCRSWPTMKKVLEFLKGILPPPAPTIIDVVIWIGERFAKKCPAPQG